MRKSAIILLTLLLITASLSAKKRNHEKLTIWTDTCELMDIPEDMIIAQEKNTYIHSDGGPAKDANGNAVPLTITNIKSNGRPKQCYLEKILPLEAVGRQDRVRYIINGIEADKECFLLIPDTKIEMIGVLMDAIMLRQYNGASKVIVVELRNRNAEPEDFKSRK